MVSNTMEDFPEPETPVKMVIFRFGIRKEIFLRLFSRAPCISIYSCDILFLLNNQYPKFLLQLFLHNQLFRKKKRNGFLLKSNRVLSIFSLKPSDNRLVKMPGGLRFVTKKNSVHTAGA